MNAKIQEVQPMTISKYLNKNLVVFLDAKTRDEALKALVDVLDREEKLQDRDAFYHAILEREKIVSTGIGMGVAIPHAKLASYDNFFIVIGIQKEGIEWNALDDSPVRLIFMIGGPDDKQTQYLKILSGLTMAIKEESRRKEMLILKNAQEIIDLFDSNSDF